MKQAAILTKPEAEELEVMVKMLGRAVTDLNRLYYGKETRPELLGQSLTLVSRSQDTLRAILNGDYDPEFHSLSSYREVV